MFNKLENFLLNRFGGKLIARGVVNLAGVLVGLAASHHINLDKAEVVGAMTIAANSLFEWFKAKRMANPASPAVQTDASKVVATASVPAPAPKP